jgi:hypothetical protein
MTRLLPLLFGQAEEQELEHADMAHQRSDRRQPARCRAEFPMHGG